MLTDPLCGNMPTKRITQSVIPMLSDLRKQITEYMKQGLIMEDVRESAEECQERISRDGFNWDRNRLLWRRPEEN